MALVTSREEHAVVWSPRRLAEIAGTSRRAVRHYHEIGLLPEPKRQHNGYQHYGVEHLIRLIRIRKLADLGLTLPQIAAVGDTDRLPAHVLHDLDAELARDIDRLQRARTELTQMMEQAAPVDLPPQVARRTEGLPAVERALVVVLTRLLDAHSLDAYLDLLPHYRAHAAVVAFDNLPDDATESSRAAVAVGLVGHMGHLTARRAAQIELIDAATQRSALARQTIQQAIGDLYNTAQLDVLTQTTLRLTGRPRP